MRLATFFIGLILLWPGVTSAQSKSDICWVTTSWWNPARGIGSGKMLLGKFQPAAFDEQTLKSFRDADSGLNANAGVEYGDFGGRLCGEAN